MRRNHDSVYVGVGVLLIFGDAQLDLDLTPPSLGTVVSSSRCISAPSALARDAVLIFSVDMEGSTPPTEISVSTEGALGKECDLDTDLLDGVFREWSSAEKRSAKGWS